MPTAIASEPIVVTVTPLDAEGGGVPSWLPADPAGWPLFGTEYVAMAPRQWPEDLYDDDTGDAYGDQRAFGRVLSMVRRASHWLVTRLWPHLDDTGEHFADWEESLGVAAAATLELRQDRLIAAMRNRGTLTFEKVRSMFAPVFGSTDPTDVSITSPLLSTIPALNPSTTEQFAVLQMQLHIFNTAQDTDIDRKMADQLLSRVTPPGETWSAGRYRDLKWDVDGQGWDVSTWVS